ncbi:E3 ubiquitin-protein ligase msl-2 [Musca vetustissima]|uniref:E3 ubiquitin-protein ligase msl-2 n=1 Tax=Musca vetustissima TaxID=27455 RepID=UPI002AB6F13B|nr:E3 ubiquitin-protein ligase msl-2 [Musca vetustissima]
MNAVSVYVNAAKLVLQTTEQSTANASTNNELPRQLLSLRQLLSCVVCCRLATDPFSPSHGHCNHSVCRLCIRGQKNLNPSCLHCRDNRDYKTYEENKQLRCLLVCYKSLCEHLRSSPVFPQLAGRKLLQYNVMSPMLSMPQMSLQDLIVEGASYDDIMSSFTKDLPKSQLSYTPNTPLPKQQPQMPALVVPLSTTAATPLAPLQQNIKCSGITQSTAPKASTPPMSVSGPISNLAQTHAPKIKVETTSPTFKPFSHAAASAPTNHNQTPAPQQSSNTTYNQPQLIQLNQLKNAGNITYIGPNTRGIVVPIVSSSGTTAVPLSIASARLQTLNRQLAQARALQVVSSAATPTATSTQHTSMSSSAVDVKPQLATFKVSLAPTQLAKTVPSLNTSPMRTSVTTATTTLTNAFTTATVTSQIRNPPAIKTVSNGSAMYSVLYTGIGNKITIKRKTDGDEDANQKKNITTSASNATIVRPISKTINKKRGCRCGNTTSTPGKLTCCGQRCPCYVDSKSCIGCKCRGCRNPHRPDGMKVRPVIPELACYEIQMADDHGNVNELPIATSSNRLAPVNGEGNETVLSSPAAATTLNLKPTFEGAATLVARNLHLTPRSSPLPSPSANTVSVQQTSNITQASLSTSSTTSAAPTISTAPGNIVQLDQMQRESLLIQNAEGKFQVVNLFTTGSAQSTTQVPGLQMLQTLPQTVVSVSGSSNFILPSTMSTTAQHSSSPVATASLPLLLHTQQQQQILQQQQQHQTMTSQRISTGTTIPLQLQQQLKQNIITVHTIGSNANANTSPASASVLTPSSSPAPTTATLTLAPMMINNPHTQTTNSTTTTDILENCADISQRYTNLVVTSSPSLTSSAASVARDVATTLPVVSLSGGGTITHRNATINLKSLGSPNT